MKKQPPRRPKRPARRLKDQGGKIIRSAGNGRWFARLGDEQAVGDTEDGAAQKILDRFDK